MALEAPKSGTVIGAADFRNHTVNNILTKVSRVENNSLLKNYVVHTSLIIQTKIYTLSFLYRNEM